MFPCNVRKNKHLPIKCFHKSYLYWVKCGTTHEANITHCEEQNKQIHATCTTAVWLTRALSAHCIILKYLSARLYLPTTVWTLSLGTPSGQWRAGTNWVPLWDTGILGRMPLLFPAEWRFSKCLYTYTKNALFTWIITMYLKRNGYVIYVLYE